MFLRRVHVDNFRGIEHLDLALEPTTVLIGENNTGKTSLLDVIDICLGTRTEDESFPIQLSDFRRSKGETDPSPERPIRLVLMFREREPGEWNRHSGARLGSILRRSRKGRRELRLEVIAKAEGARRIDVRWSLLDGRRKPQEAHTDPALLGELRRLNPFLHLRADRYSVGPGTRKPRTKGAAPEEAARRELEGEIDRVYHKIVATRGPVSPTELEKGLSSVREYLKRVAERIPARRGRPRRLLDDLVQTPLRFSWGVPEGLAEQARGTGMQSVALLLLVGALLRARGPDVIAEGAEPIVATEEPEAHLHPHMLASMWAVIDGFPAQKIITTNSGELLAAVPLRSIRRLQRRREKIKVFQPGRKLTIDEMRRIGYHIRVKRGDALFARCWLLIEGETEFWLLPELARILGHDFSGEGIRCVEFAQCGVEPLVKLARNAGIEWHLLTDGDDAGRWYADKARSFLGRKKPRDRITRLEEPDIEHCLWNHGYADVYRRIGRVRGKTHHPRTAIDRAIHAESKPYLALAVVEAAAAPESPGVPPVLKDLIGTVVRLARAVAR
jgi:putative ATP-dependent endonuclease of OLD family